MSDENTGTSAEQPEKVKLVKLSTKDEVAQFSSSQSSNRENNNDPDLNWQFRLYSSTHKVFRDFDKLMPVFGSTCLN